MKAQFRVKPEFQVTYFLWKARKDKNGNAPVYIRSKQNSDKQIPHNTGVKIHPQEWSKSKREPKNKPAALIELERKLKETYRDLLAQGYEPNLTDLLKHQNDARKPTDKNIVAWCDDYNKSGKYSEGQKKAIRTLKSNIKDFRQGLTFDKIKTPLLEKFFEHLTEKKVANNSQYKRLRGLVNVASHAGQNIPDLNNYKISYSTKNALKVRLNWTEVKKAMETETINELEALAKDVFMLACFSGLRISDILTIERGTLHDLPAHYERIQTKTKHPVLVTVHKYNEELFKKYMDKGIPYTRQTLSRVLKDVLERSGMTKKITKYKQVGNLYEEVIIEKYKEISFHSGRRFYSRLLNDLGLGGEIARDELGHSFKNVTELYAGSQEHANRVSRVRKAMETMEKTLEEQDALMKVA